MRVVGLLDRSGYVFEPRGFSRRRLLELAREKDAGALLAALGGTRGDGGRGADVDGRPRRVAAGRRRRDERGDRRPAARRARPRLRRRPGEQEAARRVVGELRGAAVADGDRAAARCSYEATVGAGLPIIDTYHKLVETGDRVLQDRRLGQRHADVRRVGRVGGQAVLAGRARGGRARLCRARSARRSVRPRRRAQGADPRAADGLSRPRAGAGRSGAASLRKLPLDGVHDAAAGGRRRVGGARRARGRARPRAALRRHGDAAWRCRRKLAAVPASSPIGALQGTRNLVAFTTRRYLTEPLVVSGPGAGAEVTAAGILNDIYSLRGSDRDES